MEKKVRMKYKQLNMTKKQNIDRKVYNRLTSINETKRIVYSSRIIYIKGIDKQYIKNINTIVISPFDNSCNFHKEKDKTNEKKKRRNIVTYMTS